MREPWVQLPAVVSQAVRLIVTFDGYVGRYFDPMNSAWILI